MIISLNEQDHGLEQLAGGPADPFLREARSIRLVGRGGQVLPPDAADLVVSVHQLQFVADYRLALKQWHTAVRVGGHLIVAVSHAFLHERSLFLPSRRHPDQRRLYSPRVLLDEVEEALEPNSYRVRLLADDDRDYDYATPLDQDARGHGDIVLVLQRLAPPDWPLADRPPTFPQPLFGDAPDYAFEPVRTRIERDRGFAPERILILKLDHLGDFVIGLPALARLRDLFPDAHFTMMVGGWNKDAAEELGLFDEVVPFDAFPRNSSEEEPDPRGVAASFHERLSDRAFDLAIDFRTDHDTRFLLRNVNATRKAGLGTRAQFPFLDIFLPIDFNRGSNDMAHEFRFGPGDFNAQGSAARHEFRISSDARTVERDCAIVWGPYRWLAPGRYIFAPFLERRGGAEDSRVALDVALDTRQAVEAVFTGGDMPRLAFEVGPDGASFEFRIWPVEGSPSLDLDFFGGRLMRAGGLGVLHQGEYQQLLVELIRLRMLDTGAPADVPGF